MHKNDLVAQLVEHETFDINRSFMKKFILKNSANSGKVTLKMSYIFVIFNVNNPELRIDVK